MIKLRVKYKKTGNIGYVEGGANLKDALVYFSETKTLQFCWLHDLIILGYAKLEFDEYNHLKIRNWQ